MTVIFLFLQVHVLADNLDVGNVNLVNLKAATSAALLLLPPEFTEVNFPEKNLLLNSFCIIRMSYTFSPPKCRKTYMLKSVASHTWAT